MMTTRDKSSLSPVVASVCVALLSIAAQAGQEDWLTDFGKAKEMAREKNVPILADFAGTDWCSWCMKLDREIFSQDAFKAYAKTNLVLFLADYPQHKQLPGQTVRQNDGLSKLYGIEGFPTVLLLDANGKELARTGYLQGGSEAYVKHLKQLIAELKKDMGPSFPAKKQKQVERTQASRHGGAPHHGAWRDVSEGPRQQDPEFTIMKATSACRLASSFTRGP